MPDPCASPRCRLRRGVARGGRADRRTSGRDDGENGAARAQRSLRLAAGARADHGCAAQRVQPGKCEGDERECKAGDRRGLAPDRHRAGRRGARRRNVPRLPHRSRIVQSCAARAGELRGLPALTDRLPGRPARRRRLSPLRSDACRLPRRAHAQVRVSPQHAAGALEGIDSLRGSAMEWSDIVDMAGIWAAALGIAVIDEE